MKKNKTMKRRFSFIFFLFLLFSFLNNDYSIVRAASKVVVGNTTLVSGRYYASNTLTTSTTSPATGGYLYYTGDKIVLNNFSYTYYASGGESSNYNYNNSYFFNSTIAISGNCDIELIGMNSLRCEATAAITTRVNYACISSYDYGSILNINGSGELHCYTGDMVGSDNKVFTISAGMYVRTLNVKDGKIYVDTGTAVMTRGISANVKITVTDGELRVKCGDSKGQSSVAICTDNVTGGGVFIYGGALVAQAGKAIANSPGVVGTDDYGKSIGIDSAKFEVTKPGIIVAEGENGEKGSYGLKTISAASQNKIDDGAIVIASATGTTGEVAAIKPAASGMHNAMLIENDTGIVNGDVTIAYDLKINENVQLTINEGATLTVKEGVTFTNHADIINNGEFVNNGITFNDGSITNNNEMINNGTIDNKTIIDNNGNVTYNEGSIVYINVGAEWDGILEEGARVYFQIDNTALYLASIQIDPENIVKKDRSIYALADKTITVRGNDSFLLLVDNQINALPITNVKYNVKSFVMPARPIVLSHEMLKVGEEEGETQPTTMIASASVSEGKHYTKINEGNSATTIKANGAFTAFYKINYMDEETFYFNFSKVMPDNTTFLLINLTPGWEYQTYYYNMTSGSDILTIKSFYKLGTLNNDKYMDDIGEVQYQLIVDFPQNAQPINDSFTMSLTEGSTSVSLTINRVIQGSISSFTTNVDTPATILLTTEIVSSEVNNSLVFELFKEDGVTKNTYSSDTIFEMKDENSNLISAGKVVDNSVIFTNLSSGQYSLSIFMPKDHSYSSKKYVVKMTLCENPVSPLNPMNAKVDERTSDVLEVKANIVSSISVEALNGRVVNSEEILNLMVSYLDNGSGETVLKVTKMQYKAKESQDFSDYNLNITIGDKVVENGVTKVEYNVSNHLDIGTYLIEFTYGETKYIFKYIVK